MQKAGIIGGSGFIGSYITRQFLDQGFEVKVSATDISKEEKYQHLMQFENAENLHICELNTNNKLALRDFLQDCDVVIHGGTPFQLEVQDAQAELFDPTIKGTENFLEIVQSIPGIQKVVFIASVAAYNTHFPLPPDGKTATDVIDEVHPRFSSVESHPYALAKFIANQTVEKFIQEHPHLSFEISSVSPVFVTGKSLSNREDSTSGGMQYLIKHKIAPNDFVRALFDQDMVFAMVDVADVANAIYNLATTTGLHGRDYLLSSESYPVSDINRMLNNLEPLHPSRMLYCNNRAKAELGMQFKPAKQSLFNYSKS